LDPFDIDRYQYRFIATKYHEQNKNVKKPHLLVGFIVDKMLYLKKDYVCFLKHLVVPGSTEFGLAIVFHSSDKTQLSVFLIFT
jgi:hypothetical protein